MIPGPDRVIACPSCRGLETHLTLLSFTDWGDHRWTDGFSLSYSHPRPPYIAKCGHCGFVYWLKDAESIGELPIWGETIAHPEWLKAEHVVEPSEADYYEALESGLGGTAREERNARLLAWWKSNESLRGETPAGVYKYWNSSPVRGDRNRIVKHVIGTWNRDPSARQTNMEQLLPLLNLREESDQLIRADLLRQLGRFDHALAVLREVESERASWIADQIQALCEEGDTLVKELDQSNRPDPFKAFKAMPKADPEGKRSWHWWLREQLRNQ